MPIPPTSSGYILLEGIRGNNEYSDIAVDDLDVIDGSCPGGPGPGVRARRAMAETKSS